MRDSERRGLWALLVIGVGVLVGKYLVVGVFSILGAPIMGLIWLMGDITGAGGGRQFVWYGEILGEAFFGKMMGKGWVSLQITAGYAVFFYGAYLAANRRLRLSPWLADSIGSLLDGVAAMPRRMRRPHGKARAGGDGRRGPPD